LILAFREHPRGVETEDGPTVVYDLERNEAHLGAVRVDGPALVWELVDEEHLVAQSHEVSGAAVAGEVRLDSEATWLLRCDRVDFPPGGVAYRHVHPGPGIRRILHGELTIDREGSRRTYRAGESWLEEAYDPVLAIASPTEDTAFVRVLLLPPEWAGKRTIRFLDPADEEKPRLQRATVLLEEPLAR
jgi:quercetin dioxygenase-like cupin family protein